MQGGEKFNRSRLSVMTDEVGRNLTEAIAFARRYNLSWVELRAESGADYYDRMPPERLKNTVTQLSDAGLKVSFLNSPLLKFTLPGTKPVRTEDFYEKMYRDLGLTPEKMFEQRLDTLKRTIDAAHMLGTLQIRSFTFWRVEDPKSVFPQLKDTLLEMAEVAGKEKIRILVENELACNMASSAETAELLGLVNHKAIALNWDPQNSTEYEARVFPEGYSLLPRKRVGNVQIKAEGLVGPGKKLDWTAIFRQLANHGYEGQFGLETHTLKGPGVNIPASHQCVKEIFRIWGETVPAL